MKWLKACAVLRLSLSCKRMQWMRTNMDVSKVPASPDEAKADLLTTSVVAYCPDVVVVLLELAVDESAVRFRREMMNSKGSNAGT